MLFIKGYYYIFYTFIILLLAVCEAIHWLKKPRFAWPSKQWLNYRSLASTLHLDFG